MEFGLGRRGGSSFRRQQSDAPTQVFFLAAVLGRAWWALSRYADVIEHLHVEGPWEITLAFRNTLASVLADLAGGWVEPMNEWRDECPPCPDNNVLIVREVESWPTPDETRALAMSLGGNIEDAWGSRQRRFLARVDPRIGEFDVSRYR